MVRNKVEWNEKNPNEIEGLSEKFQFYIRKEKGTEGVVLDIFDAKIKNNDEAHIKSITCDSKKEAKETAASFFND
jgi:hypothetical protein